MRQLVVELICELVPQMFINVHDENLVPHEKQVSKHSLVKPQREARLDQWFVSR